MNKYKYRSAFLYLSLCFVSLFFNGCRELLVENIPTGESVTLDFNVSTKSAASDNPLGSNETAIKTLRVFIFDPNTGKPNMPMRYEEFDTNTPITSHKWSIERKLGKNSIYILVNEPPALAGKLESITNQSQLEGLDYEIATHFNNPNNGYLDGDDVFKDGTFFLPMHFTETFEIKSLRPIEKNYYVKRTLARVDLKLCVKDHNTIDLKGSKLIVKNSLPKAGYPASARDVTATDFEIKYHNDDLKSYELGDIPVRYFTFYTPARPCGVNKISITLENVLKNNKLVSYPAIVLDKVKNAEGTSTVALSDYERNTIYAINGVFGSSFPIEVTIDKNEWDLFNIEEDMGGIGGSSNYLNISRTNMKLSTYNKPVKIYFRTNSKLPITISNDATLGTVAYTKGHDYFTYKCITTTTGLTDEITIKTGKLARVVKNVSGHTYKVGDLYPHGGDVASASVVLQVDVNNNNLTYLFYDQSYKYYSWADACDVVEGLGGTMMTSHVVLEKEKAVLLPALQKIATARGYKWMHFWSSEWHDWGIGAYWMLYFCARTPLQWEWGHWYDGTNGDAFAAGTKTVKFDNL
jgi:hypothetical protein